MKKILLSLTTILAMSSAIQAAEYKDYVEVSVGQFLVEDDKALNVEPLSNIVGGDSTALTIKLGLHYPKTGAKYVEKGTIYTYVTIHDNEKNNEAIVGIGAQFYSDKINDMFRLRADFGAGIGKQFNNGDSVSLSSNVTNISYVTGDYQMGSYTGVYTKDTNVFEINLGFALNWDTPVENMYVNTGYMYHYKNYDFEYQIDGDDKRMSLSGVVQNAHEFNIGVEYRF